MGGVAAAISKTAAAPIELIKLRIQNMDEMIKSGVLDKPYRGILDCGGRVVKSEGVRALWQGNLANVLRYFPTQALNFAFKDYYKRKFKAKKGASFHKKLVGNILSGGFAGMSSLLFVYTLDYARTRLANDKKGSKKGSERKFKTIRDVYAKTYKSDGIRGLYRGFVISSIGIFIYRGFYFGLFDTAQIIVPKKFTQYFVVDFLLGWAITISAGLLSYPIDTVRRRMMMTSGEKVKYKNSLDCAISIVRQEGVSSLYKGAYANILRGIAGAGVLAGYKKLKQLFFPDRR